MTGRSASLAQPVIALTASIVTISAVLLALGASPIAVFADLLQGAFGNWLAFTDTLAKSIPLIFAGLAVSIAFQGALWNIGADGQLLIGALVAGAIGPALGAWPHPAAIGLMLASGAAGGAFWGAIAGELRARRGVSEVITTIMLNFVAAQLLSFAVHGPLMEPTHSFPASVPIADSARLHLYLAPSRLNAGMLIAVALAALCYLFLFHGAAGFELRALGRNRRASAFYGIPIARLTIGAMMLSGALAGLGGAIQVSAITHRLYETLSPGWGYEAIAVALVARLNPIAVVPAAILFGALDNGSQAMQRADAVSPVLVNVIQAMVILIMLALGSSAAAGMRAAILGIRGVSPAMAPEVHDA